MGALCAAWFTASLPAEITTTLAEAVFVESACDLAVTVAVAGLGIVFGAVYSPEVSILPKVAFPPVIPFTCQVTAWFVVPLTVAMKGCLAPTSTVACVGDIKTRTEARCGTTDPEPPHPGNESKDRTTKATGISGRLGIVPLVF
jgi:hypothetical protein